MSITKLDWKFVLSLFAAIAGIAVPVLLWQFDLSSRSLSVQLSSSIALEPKVDASMHGLQVMLDGVKVELPHLSTLELTNSGSKPIAASDFEGPLEIRIKQGRLVRARVDRSNPRDLPASISTDENVVKLQPLLLNPGDSIIFAIVTSQQAPEFDPFARVSGVAKVLYKDSSTKLGWGRAAFSFTQALLAFCLYMMFAVSVIRPNTVLVSRALAICTMIVCAAAGSLLLQRALRSVGFDDSQLNLAVSTGLAAFGGVPLFFRQLRISRRFIGKG